MKSSVLSIILIAIVCNDVGVNGCLGGRTTRPPPSTTTTTRQPTPTTTRAPTGPSAATCLCLSGNGVNVRDSACGTVIGSSSQGDCFQSMGAANTCYLGTTRYTYYKLDYRGTIGWISSSYLIVASSSQCAPKDTGCSGLTMVTRSQWGARSPKSTSTLRHPTPRTFVHHTASASHVCTSTTTCSSKVRGIQNYHMDTRDWSDIGYNFLISADGKVYEGRGWDRVGAHASSWNSVSVGISMMGEFSNSLPTISGLTALDNLIKCGVSMGKLSAGYSLHGHRDGVCTDCPGDRLYSYVRMMNRYAGRLVNC